MSVIIFFGLLILILTFKGKSCKNCKHLILHDNGLDGSCALHKYSNKSKWNPVTGKYERIKNKWDEYNCKKLNKNGLCREFEQKYKNKN